MSNKLLSTVPVPFKNASIFSATCLPVMKGSEEDNLLCGSCSVVLAEGVSEQTLATRFAVRSELLVRCPKCGALNELPAQVAP
jgi:phage FluMu protein Com